MASSYHWICPYCNHDIIIRKGDYFFNSTRLVEENADGEVRLQSLFIICPNSECRKVTLKMTLYSLKWDSSLSRWVDNEIIKQWDLIPSSKAKTFPSYIPSAIIEDYNEACLICMNSPKASATLSRRCLQGIIRDYWKVKPGRLVDEIEQIKDKTDQLSWEAIDSVRKVGNIGAHMEKDINVIIEVDPQEAELLINLIETLIKDWYILREERKIRLNQIKNIAKSKGLAKNNPN